MTKAKKKAPKKKPAAKKKVAVTIKRKPRAQRRSRMWYADRVQKVAPANLPELKAGT